MLDKLIQLTMGNNTRLGYTINNSNNIEETIEANENIDKTEDTDEYYFRQLPPYYIGFITVNENTKYYDKENYIIKDNDDLFSTKFYMEKHKNGFQLYVKPFDIKFYLSVFSLDIVEFEKDNKYADVYEIIEDNIVSLNSDNSKFVLNFRHTLHKNNDKTNNEYHPHYLSLISEKCVKNYPQEYKPISIL